MATVVFSMVFSLGSLQIRMRKRGRSGGGAEREG
jgi:hypothetical protein